MEAKLREYRARRRREELELERTKEELAAKEMQESEANCLIPKISNNMDNKKNDEILLMDDNVRDSRIPPHTPMVYEDPDDDAGRAIETLEEIPESWRYFITKWSMYTIIWITMYIFFLKEGFGAVFFGISLLIGICLNTRTRRKMEGEVSAYSVFNENCEQIEGTLDAEELQRQMLFGVAGIRIG